MTASGSNAPIRYTNPVHAGYFADPFVLRASDGFYYAYGTSPQATADVRQFPVLRSPDLARWQQLLEGALEPLRDPPALSYWAPEVAFHDDRFLMFYSASTSQSDADHRIRIALSYDPSGPFVDSGRLLLPELGFTIDASPFQDPVDGAWYLFFATDYEQDAPYGTGVAVVRLAGDLMSAVGEIRPVVRASADWHIFERNRNYKGRVWAAWHCVEGPSAVFHDGKYYCFYSGGAWHGDAYGVGFAVADHPLGPWRDERAGKGPAVLQGIPGKVLGPGHNSTILGPDAETLFMAYHAWDAAHTARRMFIDPIVWTADGPRVDGPSTWERTIPGPQDLG
ncbi:MAG TPA: glycoside hydrolase family 43 protein [Hyphomicrobiaceae bacterium]|nr:glycoside hydrolase family 43 protein [Hyphomicrobiaceae bacterium]